MCELNELSSMHLLDSTTSTLSKTLLKTHRASNNLNIIETESNSSSRRVNDTSLGECQTTKIHLNFSSSPYSSPGDVLVGQQPLNLSFNNSTSDPLLSASTLSSVTDNQRINGCLTEGEAAQRCTNDVSPGECREAAAGTQSPSFYLSSTLNLSSSSSSSSDSAVSIYSFLFFSTLVFMSLTTRFSSRIILIIDSLLPYICRN